MSNRLLRVSPKASSSSRLAAIVRSRSWIRWAMDCLLSRSPPTLSASTSGVYKQNHKTSSSTTINNQQTIKLPSNQKDSKVQLVCVCVCACGAACWVSIPVWGRQLWPGQKRGVSSCGSWALAGSAGWRGWRAGVRGCPGSLPPASASAAPQTCQAKKATHAQTNIFLAQQLQCGQSPVKSLDFFFTWSYRKKMGSHSKRHIFKSQTTMVMPYFWYCLGHEWPSPDNPSYTIHQVRNE